MKIGILLLNIGLIILIIFSPADLIRTYYHLQRNLKKKYLKSSFYKEVDETVAVIPKRDIPTDYYFR